MFTSINKIAFICAALCIQLGVPQSRHNQYATILQDARNEPTPDGTFGYLYKTEDGITSSARGDPSGVIHGTFSYTDPTGLKVNYNYNAGSRVAPGYNYDNSPAEPAAVPSPKYRNAAPAPVAPPRGRSPSSYRDESQYYRQPPQDEYVEPAPRYRPRPRPAYREPVDGYQSGNSRAVPRENDVYNDYNYRR